MGFVKATKLAFTRPNLGAYQGEGGFIPELVRVLAGQTHYRKMTQFGVRVQGTVLRVRDPGKENVPYV